MPARRLCMAVGAVALALTGCGDGDDDGRPAPGSPVIHELKRIEDVRDRKDFALVPREQQRQTRRIIAADRRLADLLGGIGYRLGRMGPWTNGGSPVGVIVDLPLERPLTRDDVWLPAVSSQEDGRPYRDSNVHLRITAARELTLLVEFRRAKVVSIEPEVGSSEIYPDTPRQPLGEH